MKAINPTVKEVKELQTYTFPELGVAIKAESMEDAIIKVKKEIK